MRLLLLGANGQVGHELRRSLAPLGEVVATTRTGMLPDGGPCEALDLHEPGSAARMIERVRPDAVINAAAYTAVDRAEDEPASAFRIQRRSACRTSRAPAPRCGRARGAPSPARHCASLPLRAAPDSACERRMMPSSENL